VTQKDCLNLDQVNGMETILLFYAINLEDASVNIYYLDEDNKIYPLLVDPFNQTDSWSNGSELLVFSEFNGKYFSIYEYNNNEKINLTSSITNDCFYPTYSPDKKIRFFYQLLL
jgi:hypothetical protein